MIGVHFLVGFSFLSREHLIQIRIDAETLAAHRAQRLLTMLPNALTTGLSESEHSQEHLKVSRPFLEKSAQYESAIEFRHGHDDRYARYTLAFLLVKPKSWVATNI